jgi:hypothetical protein
MFMKTSAIGGMAIVAAPSMLTMEGCNTAQLEAYLNDVLDSAVKILALTSATDSWYKGLVAAIAALKATESGWSGATATADIISALDTVEAVMAAIPLTAVYSPLVDLAVTAIELILTTFVSTSNPVALPKALAMGNPHRGRVALRQPHFLQSRSGAYKSQWDDTAKGLGLTSSKL